MKFILDLPSAATGAAVSAAVVLALTSPVLASLRVLDYSGSGTLQAVSGLAVLAGAAFLADKTALKPSKAGSATARQVAETFPSSVLGADTEPSLRPTEWIHRNRAAMPWAALATPDDLETFVEAGLALQVQHVPDKDLVSALTLAFDGFARGGKDRAVYMNELTRRMQRCLAEKTAFDLKAYASTCAAIGHLAPQTPPAPFSAFPVVDLVERYIACRATAVLASAEFVWLKQVDRTLWYALNNVGRKTFHIEALGIMAHHARQKASPSKILHKPDVLDGVAGVMAYLDTHGIDLLSEKAA